jgi:multidrug efflux pump
VLVTGPLGLIGAASALLIFQAPFGFVAILGVIALAVIMRNSIILVDQVQQDLVAGHDAFTAIIESAVRRFRSLTLTAAAAVLALIPLVRDIFRAPMALAMMGDLIAATVLTLTFLPARYASSFRVATLHPNPGSDPELPVRICFRCRAAAGRGVTA